MAYIERIPLERIPSVDLLPDSPTEEQVPHLLQPHVLQLISSEDYSSHGSGPSDGVKVHSAIDMPNLPSDSSPKGPEFVRSSSEPSSADNSLPVDDHVSNVSTGDVRNSAAEHASQPPKSSSFHILKSAMGKRGWSPNNLRAGFSTSSRGLSAELIRKVSFASKAQEKLNTSSPASVHAVDEGVRLIDPLGKASRQKGREFFSQPIPTIGSNRPKRGPSYSGPVRRCSTVDPVQALRERENDDAKTANYGLFRTKSTRFDKQLSRRQSREAWKINEEQKLDGASSTYKIASEETQSVPAGRYFDALQGPELEHVKESEELLLPVGQTWPFLLRFPIGCFGICMGLGSQAMLYKTLAMSPATGFLHIPLGVNFALWCLALTALCVVSITYGLKCLLYFEAVKREYHHPVRVNFFFAPWIACMFLTIGIPPRIANNIHPAVWCIFAAPLFLLKLKIYGQWLSGGQRRLSKVANPSTHLSLVGNFVSAVLSASVGWKEAALFFWAVGCAHYLVVFVTLYQRLPTAEVLPKELHPVFFLFVAAPSVASVSWKTIVGSFDNVSKIAYFLALFLYASLIVRVNFFCGFQ